MPRRLRAVAGAALILLASAVCIRLGFWQLSRLEERRARNEVVARGMASPPERLTPEVLRRLADAPEAWRWRRAAVRGEYEPEGEVLLRGRADGGRPGVHVVTPLRVGQHRVLVNRGWVPAPDAARPPVRPPPPVGDVAVTGILMEIPRTADGGTPSRTPDGAVTYRRLDLGALREAYGPGLAPLYLQAAGDSGALPRPVPAPRLDEGPHLSYAVQWFAFAAIGIAGLLILLLRGGGKVRR